MAGGCSPGRFLSADTLIPDPGDPVSYDRYAYTRNNPVRYTDPSGHWLCDPYDQACAENEQETATFQIMAAGYQPGSWCWGDPLCADSYDTFVELTATLERVPTENEILYMTAGTEYYSYIGYHKDVRAVGQEGLARNYYEACGVDGCQGSELYRFLAGFQPWYGKPYEMGDGSASARAAHMVDDGLYNDFAGTGAGLRNDVGNVLNTEYAGHRSRRWTDGKYPNRPWQWFGPFALDPTTNPSYGFGSENAAILNVNLGGGKVFWMFTGIQDSNFKPKKDYWSLP
jgi:hypothetical protein